MQSQKQRCPLAQSDHEAFDDEQIDQAVKQIISSAHKAPSTNEIEYCRKCRHIYFAFKSPKNPYW